MDRRSTRGQAKKRVDPAVSETGAPNNASCRLHVVDKHTRVKYLIDTGADVSLVPRPADFRREPQPLRLFAANDSRINTYGSLRRVLHIGLRRPIKWKFVVADVPYPIIGADLLYHYNLSVDLRRQALIDESTSLSVKTGVSSVNFSRVSIVSPDCKYRQLLTLFPRITGAEPPVALEERGVFHHIETTGPPVSQRVRRLAPNKYNAAKAEFKRLCEAGLCRPSNSPWATPIHLVDKEMVSGVSWAIIAN